MKNYSLDLHLILHFSYWMKLRLVKCVRRVEGLVVMSSGVVFVAMVMEGG